MKQKFQIFYSWQSDLNNKTNNFFIRDTIKEAIKKISKNNIDLEIRLDKDTQGIPGSIPIVDTIFRKITTSDIFIADVSIVSQYLTNSAQKSKKTPNPNVLIELGYAIKVLGWKRIICIANDNYSKIEDLPFDIRHHRITTFNLSQDAPKEKIVEVKKKLTETFIAAIKLIIKDYDNILKDFREQDYKSHDILKFENLSTIYKEEQFKEDINNVVTTKWCYSEKFENWRNFDIFCKLEGNRFIDEEINIELDFFLKKLDDFIIHCFTVMQTDERIGKCILQNGEEIDNWISKILKPNSNGWSPKSQKEYDENIGKLSDLSLEVFDSYKNYRKIIKTKLFT
jgi:hypothetical protein